MLRFLLPLLATVGAAAALAGSPEPMTPATPIDFTLQRAAAPDTVRLDLRTARDSNTGARYATTALPGLDVAQLTRDGGRIAFALPRQPGRLDCAGESHGGRATGQCRFAPDPAFADFLASRGVARPTFEQAFQLATTGVTRALVQAVVDARYPTPSPNTLAGLAAVGVTPDYLAALAAHGFRPAKLESVIAMKAVGVTPEYVAGLERSGYARLDPDIIIQFRAIGVTPAYLAELAAAGYHALPAGEVAQLRALDVTGGYIASFAAIGYPHLSAGTLVQMKAVGVTPDDVRAARDRRGAALTPDELVRSHVLAGLEHRR